MRNAPATTSDTACEITICGWTTSRLFPLLEPGAGPALGSSSGNSRATTATGAAPGGSAAARFSRCRYWAITPEDAQDDRLPTA